MGKDWMKIGVAVYVAGIIAYLIVKHTGMDEGQIKPADVYIFFSGVFATKIVDFAFSSMERKKGVKK